MENNSVGLYHKFILNIKQSDDVLKEILHALVVCLSSYTRLSMSGIGSVLRDRHSIPGLAKPGIEVGILDDFVK